MTAEAWPTEDAATKAVDAAARAVWAAEQKKYEGGFQHLADWADLPAHQQLSVREQVLPIVWAALEALPDPRRIAWEQGYVAGYSHGCFDSTQIGEHVLVRNPYPSGL